MTSKLEYDRLIGEWLAGGRSLASESSRETIAVVTLSAAYCRFCKTYYVKSGKPTDEQAGVKAAIKHLKCSYPKTHASDFGKLSLEPIREQRIASRNSRRYINQNIGRIERMFKRGVSIE